MNAAPQQERRPKTKIVCTLGPSTETPDTIQRLIATGMSVARLNLSHGTLESHETAIERVREASKELGIPVGIMVDVPGSKYRVGPLAPGVVELRPGDSLILTSEDVVGNPQRISVSPPGIHRDATVGHQILLDDGLMELLATGISGNEVRCDVVVGGRLTERRGVTTPGKAPSQPFPDERSVEGLRFAAQQGADFVALSTVTGDDDVHKAREVLQEVGFDGQIISKIERAEALENFDDILDASDGIMVARGDMGVDVPLARVPVIQKDLISRCNALGKPVITATQMLESMVHSQVPTRAEVTDVANAIFDGTDAIMLSGETSVGEYPVQAVNMMAQVAVVAEEALPYEAIIREKARQLQEQTDDAISYDACRTAFQLNASLIVAFTESGSTADRVSKYRPRTPILALTQDDRVQRRLTLRWGVTPVIVRGLTDVEDFFTLGEEQALEVPGVEPGSRVVLVAGVPIGVPGGTNLLRVMTVQDGPSHTPRGAS
ncbi:MAG: pyruvate kinase [Chloroflexi bacterium]|nr:pyruvate kinase [Chloroflexota bacterium]